MKESFCVGDRVRVYFDAKKIGYADATVSSTDALYRGYVDIILDSEKDPRAISVELLTKC